MKTSCYPGLLERVKAAMADTVVSFFFMVVIAHIFSAFDVVPDTARILAFLFIFLLYDPIFTSSFGGTIGHMIMGIRVKQEKNQEKNVLFPLAILRFISKAFLGWISLLTVTSNEKRKALHDLIVGTVVVYKK